MTEEETETLRKRLDRMEQMVKEIKRLLDGIAQNEEHRALDEWVTQERTHDQRAFDD
jgi:phosphoglycerate-specific signal transduction histidine kinase